MPKKLFVICSMTFTFCYNFYFNCFSLYMSRTFLKLLLFSPKTFSDSCFFLFHHFHFLLKLLLTFAFFCFHHFHFLLKISLTLAFFTSTAFALFETFTDSCLFFYFHYFHFLLKLFLTLASFYFHHFHFLLKLSLTLTFFTSITFTFF